MASMHAQVSCPSVGTSCAVNVRDLQQASRYNKLKKRACFLLGFRISVRGRVWLSRGLQLSVASPEKLPPCLKGFASSPEKPDATSPEKLSKVGMLCAGINVRDLQQASLRQQVAVVPQDTVLFNDTVFNNVGYGRPGADPADVITAAGVAEQELNRQAHRWLIKAHRTGSQRSEDACQT